MLSVAPLGAVEVEVAVGVSKAVVVASVPSVVVVAAGEALPVLLNIILPLCWPP